jgi:hypothetical protein
LWQPFLRFSPPKHIFTRNLRQQCHRISLEA